MRAHILRALWGYKRDFHLVVFIRRQDANPYNMSKQRCFRVDTRIDWGSGETSRGGKVKSYPVKQEGKNIFVG